MAEPVFQISGLTKSYRCQLTGSSDHELTLYRRIGFVFQFYNLIPSLTAKENVALATEVSTNLMRPEALWNSWGSRTDYLTARRSYPGASSSGS